MAAPAPVPELAARLEGYRADFLGNVRWRYAVVPADSGHATEPGRPAGEVSLFPRTATARVALAEADRVEVGYWLRADLTGRGYVTEAVAAVLAAAATLPRLVSAEIHCDPANAPSAAVPRRLGFTLVGQTADTMVWSRPLHPAPSPDEVAPLLPRTPSPP